MLGNYPCDVFVVDGYAFGYNGHKVYVVDDLGSHSWTFDVAQRIAENFFVGEQECEKCERVIKKQKR